jgi:hypothetical protein
MHRPCSLSLHGLSLWLCKLRNSSTVLASDTVWQADRCHYRCSARGFISAGIALIDSIRSLIV